MQSIDSETQIRSERSTTSSASHRGNSQAELTFRLNRYPHLDKSNKDKKSYKRESICILIVTFALGRTGYPEKNSHSKYTLSLKADLMHSKDDTSRAAM